MVKLGKHVALKMLWAQALVGSNPTFGTFMPKAKLPFKEFQWTPNLAYAIGLLVTDGNLSKDGRHINLKSSDIDLLKTFRSLFNLKNKIALTHNNGFAKKPHYRIQFGNIQFYNWLVSIGIMPAKTHIISKIKIPEEYFRDFLRGHLDGDGTIFSYQDHYNIYKGKRYINTRIYTKFISASEKHIRWLHRMIIACSPAKGVIQKHKPYKNRVSIWEIKFSKYESLELFKWLYYKKDLPTLKRKRDIAENLLSQVVNNKLIRVA